MATVFIPAGLNPARHLGDIYSLKELCSTAVLCCSEKSRLANQVLDEFEGIRILSESEEIQIDELESNEDIVFLFGSSTRQFQYKLFHDLQEKYSQEIRIFSKIKKNSTSGGVIDQVIVEVGKKNLKFNQVQLSIEDGWKVLPNTLKDMVIQRDGIMVIETSFGGFDTGDDFAHVKFLPHLYQWEMNFIWPKIKENQTKSWYRRWSDECLELVSIWRGVMGNPSILAKCQEIQLPKNRSDQLDLIIQRFKTAKIMVKNR
ncbi:MAG: hypothetical protein CMA23_006570 [Methanobacteriota archaeon]|nr:MAG: hypothetical protein CBE15_01495 [Euryarchaeota archaeon TMED255]RAH09015.1 MAG: hypothetical protein CMA23_006570 [Euryarchaeota archaeon]